MYTLKLDLCRDIDYTIPIHRKIPYRCSCVLSQQMDDEAAAGKTHMKKSRQPY
jgi:hypothetical protein